MAVTTTDADEFEDHCLHAIAAGIQGASRDVSEAAQLDFSPEGGGASLTQYLQTNRVSDHLARAVFASLRKHGLQIIEAANA